MSAERDAVRARKDCRLCGSSDLVEVFSFGETPPANAYIADLDISKPELHAPLVVNVCNACKLVQLRDVIDPEVLFSNYLYVSGTSPVFVSHFSEYAKVLAERFSLPESSLVVDVGSNDGVLLSHFKKQGMKVLGVDPAQNIAEEATKKGIPTIASFFTPETARAIAVEHGRASVITANNVFAHTDDVTGFVESVKELLAKDGAFVFEVQYLKDLIENNLFDMIYHEHLCYYHLAPLVPFFDRLGLQVFDVEHVSTHGGSIRVYVGWENAHPLSENVAHMLEKESELNNVSTYLAFAARISVVGEKLRSLIEGFLREGKRIIGYGAPAKATTLCYALGIDGGMLDYIVDDSPMKQGLYMPGTHISIKPSDVIYIDKPDCCLILAWNFADSIIKNHKKFIDQGGMFIIPVPEPRIVS